MNTPSTSEGNWAWKLTGFGELKEEIPRVAELVSLFGRTPARSKESGAPR
jgi:4-alpha-glucanotransferase